MTDWPLYDFDPANGGNGVLSTANSLLGLSSNVIPASVAWPSANRAIFVPFRVSKPCIVYKMAIGSGATAAGNFDVGIYDLAGNRVVSSGATAKGASVEHIIDVTDTMLGAGFYYFALAADGTNNYVLITPTGTSPVPLQKSRLYGTLEAASSYVLPASVTMVARTSAEIPMIAAYTRSY